MVALHDLAARLSWSNSRLEASRIVRFAHQVPERERAVLAASQDHAFGHNSNRRDILRLLFSGYVAYATWAITHVPTD